MTTSPNWFRYALDRPRVEKPGQVFNYSTGTSQLLSAVLQDATGMSALEYADMALFKPLGITQREWPADPQGVTIGGAELQLTTRDMAKFGYLYLNAGRWDDRQIVSTDWVRDSLKQHVTVMPDLEGNYPPLGYGYLWWLRPQAGYASAMAVGYGGQYVYILPALDLCVVMTGRLTDIPEMFADNRMIRSFNVVEEFIVPAVDGAPGGDSDA
jgi:CubicO group peptidase (beta-lactamase class C family)